MDRDRPESTNTDDVRIVRFTFECCLCAPDPTTVSVEAAVNMSGGAADAIDAAEYPSLPIGWTILEGATRTSPGIQRPLHVYICPECTRKIRRDGLVYDISQPANREMVVAL